ncbi:hypothetical protein Cni_G28431 [Canna indica]|uniref:Uncharacterized protein n=1 Tax=Canna indica TaxID=4628 RepID=A0AAQ3L3G0_9LILI|nr:hypothetical protein Cni_G28431 [Canna indica]
MEADSTSSTVGPPATEDSPFSDLDTDALASPRALLYPFPLEAPGSPSCYRSASCHLASALKILVGYSGAVALEYLRIWSSSERFLFEVRVD